MIISFSASVTGVNTLLSKKFAWKINDLSTENLLDPVLNYTEWLEHGRPFARSCPSLSHCQFLFSLHFSLYFFPSH